MKRLLLSALMISATAAPAFAEYIQTTGIGARNRALGGATVSDSSPSDAFYVNPAGAGFFESPSISQGGSIFDARGATFNSATDSFEVKGTVDNSGAALLPEFSAYYPLAEGLVLGLGVGVPFGLGADLERTPGVPQRSAQLVQTVSVDMSPMIAYRPTARFSIGAALNVQILENFAQTSIVDYTDTPVPVDIFGTGTPIPLVVGDIVGLNGGGGDKLTFKTKRNVDLPIPPNDFRTLDLDAIGFTLGAQFRVTDALSVGASYRSKQVGVYELEATLSTDGSLTAPAQTLAKSDAVLEIGLPGHLQIGASYDVIPGRLKIMGDVQVTFWSDAEGFGKPSYIRTPNWTVVGDGTAVGDSLAAAATDVVSEKGTAILLDYKAEDTVSFRFGAELTPEFDERLKLRAGYWYDPSPFPDETVDVITYSTDRHYFSLGAGYDMRDEDGSGFILDVGATLIYLEDRVQDDLPLYTSAASVADDNDVVEQQSSGEEFNYGGSAYGFGASLTYVF